MNSRDITVYLDERWCAALEAQSGKAVETLLTEQMDILIQQLPQEQRKRITQELRQEDQEQAQEAEANRRFSITRITENGESRCLLLEKGENMFQTARRLRRYLRGELQDPSQLYGDAVPIPQEEMERHTAELLLGSPRVVGIYDIDLDAGKVYSLDPGKGWRCYRIKDVSTVAYFATRQESFTWGARQSLFDQKLAEREIPHVSRPILVRGSRPLPVDQVCFAAHIGQLDHRLIFYVPTHFDVDTVIGIPASTSKDNSVINLYAIYDVDHGCVKDAFEVSFIRSSGPDLTCEYRLAPEEQEVIRLKMGHYCMEQMGMSLEDAGAQYLAEEQSSATQEGSQQAGPLFEM